MTHHSTVGNSGILERDKEQGEYFSGRFFNANHSEVIGLQRHLHPAPVQGTGHGSDRARPVEVNLVIIGWLLRDRMAPQGSELFLV